MISVGSTASMLLQALSTKRTDPAAGGRTEIRAAGTGTINKLLRNAVVW